MPRTGADLALLLLGGYRSFVDAAMAELATQGFEDFRPSLEFAMRAIAAGADSASDLARRTSVSKQAAAKTIAVLVERGYVASEADPADGRRKRLRVTPVGSDLLDRGEAAFEALRATWAEKIGEAELEALEGLLRTLVGGRWIDPANPGAGAVD
jgi:DNA-binding MarR family transcriptional regulator